MPTVADLLIDLEERGTLGEILNNPEAQFGVDDANYWGATILPVQPRDENKYTEAEIKWSSVVAVDSTRYSPVTLRDSVRTGSLEVSLGEKDAGDQLYGANLEAVKRSLNGGKLRGAPDAESLIARFVITAALRPLLDKEEKERLEVMTDATFYRRGDNGIDEDIPMPNPVGQRITVTDELDDDTVNPLDVIEERLQFLSDKGHPATAIATSSRVIMALRKHPKVRNAVASFPMIADSTGNVSLGLAGVATLDQINAYLEANGYGPIAIRAYDAKYRTVYGTKRRFLRENAMLFVSTNPVDVAALEAASGEGVELDIPTATDLGYYGIGIAEGAEEPGRVLRTKFFDEDKPQKITAKAWETSGPVILTPEAIAVANFVFTTPGP